MQRRGRHRDRCSWGSLSFISFSFSTVLSLSPSPLMMLVPLVHCLPRRCCALSLPLRWSCLSGVHGSCPPSISGPRSPVHDPPSTILRPRSPVHDLPSRILHPGSPVRDHPSRIPRTRSPTQDPMFRILSPGSPVKDLPLRIPRSGSFPSV
jgi:hypothetical protein